MVGSGNDVREIRQGLTDITYRNMEIPRNKTPPPTPALFREADYISVLLMNSGVEVAEASSYCADCTVCLAGALFRQILSSLFQGHTCTSGLMLLRDSSVAAVYILIS